MANSFVIYCICTKKDGSNEIDSEIMWPRFWKTDQGERNREYEKERSIWDKKKASVDN